MLGNESKSYMNHIIDLRHESSHCQGHESSHFSGTWIISFFRDMNHLIFQGHESYHWAQIWIILSITDMNQIIVQRHESCHWSETLSYHWSQTWMISLIILHEPSYQNVIQCKTAKSNNSNSLVFNPKFYQLHYWY